jgi:hypothetical protein
MMILSASCGKLLFEFKMHLSGNWLVPCPKDKQNQLGSDFGILVEILNSYLNFFGKSADINSGKNL